MHTVPNLHSLMILITMQDHTKQLKVLSNGHVELSEL